MAKRAKANLEPPRGPLRVWQGDRKLTKEETQEVLSRLNSKQAHMLGREAPRLMRESGRELTGCHGRCHRICRGDRSYYMGHGVCVLKRIVEKDPMCSKCRSDEIVNQINWIFAHFRKKFPEGLRAAYDLWKGKKKEEKPKKERKKKGKEDASGSG